MLCSMLQILKYVKKTTLDRLLELSYSDQLLTDLDFLRQATQLSS